MSEYLVIRLSSEDQPVQWLRADQNGTRLSNVSTGSLQDAALAADSRPVIAMVPAVDVLLTTVHMPIRSVSRIRTALPFAFCTGRATGKQSRQCRCRRRRKVTGMAAAIAGCEHYSDQDRR